MSRSRSITALLVMLPLLVAAIPARSADEFTISISNHKFDPSEVTVPAGKKVKLVIKNLDSTPEEFESHDLRREKIIPGKGEGIVYIGPLKPGTYKFFGEFHEATAKGTIVAK